MSRTCSQLPETICVLDVETEDVDLDHPEGAVLAFVGVIVYTLEDGQYVPGPHRCFTQEQLGELEGVLRAVPGPIIGHNILGFDYRVLRPHINLDGIVDKTIDTLLLLFERPDMKLRGLSLQALSKGNLGEGKTLKGASAPDLWKRGDHETVIAYNASDCQLTQKLWHCMVTERSVTVGTAKKPHILELGPAELRLLQGSVYRFSYQDWVTKLNRDGYITAPRRRKRRTMEEWEELEAPATAAFFAPLYWARKHDMEWKGMTLFVFEGGPEYMHVSYRGEDFDLQVTGIVAEDGRSAIDGCWVESRGTDGQEVLLPVEDVLDEIKRNVDARNGPS